MKTYEVLEKARKLIEEPARWTQGAYARNEKGFFVSALSNSAVCWCSQGAVAKAAGGEDPLVCVSFEALYEVCNNVIKFNDSHTHEEVLAMFDKAIAIQKEKDQ